MTANPFNLSMLARWIVFIVAPFEILLVPNYALAGVKLIMFPYECSIGGNIDIPLRRPADNIPTLFRNLQIEIQSKAESNAELVVIALKKFRTMFCAVEYQRDLDVEHLASGDELRKLVEALVLIGSRQDVEEKQRSIAADLALQLSAHLTDDAQRTAVRRKMIPARLGYAVTSEDAATVGTLFSELFDDQVRELLSKKGDLKANPYTAMKEVEKAISKFTVRDLARVNHLGIQRALYSLVAKFPDPGRSAVECIGVAQRTGALRALLVGVGEYNSNKLKELAGPINDIELLKRTLEVRGIEEIRVAANVTRDEVISQMRALVLDTDCGDSILFHFSGHSLVHDYSCFDNKSACAPKGWNIWLSLTDATEEGTGVLYAAELSQFISAIRNRGANVAMIIDTNNAAGLKIADLQKLAIPPSKFWTGRLIASDGHVNKDHDLGSITAIHERAGAFAVLYAGDTGHDAVEGNIKISEQEERQLGFFTYAVAKALQTSENPTVRELLSAVDQEYLAVVSKRPISQRDRSRPVLDASAPDMRFFGGKELTEQDTLDIEILSPEQTRGVRVVENPTFNIVGRLNNPGKYANLSIDWQPVEVASNGQFLVEIELSPGRTELQFVAIDYNFVFHTKKIEFELPDDVERLASEVRKYALLIGNQDYIDDYFRNLETPHRDVKAIGNLLRDRYGFETTIQSSTGSVFDLTLLNATQRQIQSTIRVLKNRLTENSTLIVYYAGHGVYQKDIDRAYWLPVDAEPDADYTWIKATDLTDTLKQFAARNILVVADSCYSGAIAKRDVPELITLDENRRKALLKAATRKSRILISSGGTEPVLDGGGGAHSVFARAFITALKGMDKEIFSSQEMYSQFIYPMVQGNENQEPQHKELEQSGHEGGDVVFWQTSVGDGDSHM